MVDHGQHGVVVVFVLFVQKGGVAPVVPRFAGAQQFRNVHSGPKDFNVVGQFLRFVLGEQDGQFRKDPGVHLFQAQPLLQQLHDLVKVAQAFVQINDVLQMVRVDNDFQPGRAGQTKLTRHDTRFGDFLPGTHRPGGFRGFDGFSEFRQGQVARRQHGKVGHGSEQQFAGVVHAFFVTTIPDAFNVPVFGRGQEFLQLGQLLALGEGVHEFRVDHLFLQRLAGHLQKLHQFQPTLVVLGLRDDGGVVRRIVRFDERFNAFLGHALGGLFLANFGPDLRFPHTFRVLVTSFDVVQVVQQDVHRVHVTVEFFVNFKRFLVHFVFVVLGNLGDGVAVEVVQPMNVVHHTALVLLAAHRGQNQQILQIFVLAEIRGTLQNNFFQQFNQFVLQIFVDERFHRDAQGIGVFVLGQRGTDHFVHQLAAKFVFFVQHRGPQRRVHSFHHVPCLVFEQTVDIGHVDQFFVATAPRTFVGQKSQERV